MMFHMLWKDALNANKLEYTVMLIIVFYLTFSSLIILDL